MNIIGGDIDLKLIGTGTNDDDRAISIALPFNRSLKRLINIAKAKLSVKITAEQRYTLERMQKIVVLLDEQLPFFMLARCYGHIMRAQKPIIENDKQYFIHRDYSEMIKKDKYMEFIKDLVNIIKQGLDLSTEDELSVIWDYAFVLLYCSTKFNEHITQTGIEYGQTKPDINSVPY